jgi:hypothetical protein
MDNVIVEHVLLLICQIFMASDVYCIICKEEK